MYDQAIILRQLMQGNTRRQTMVSSWGVLGAKGGVGTTSVAIALALESARLGFRTLLIDMTSTDDVARVLRRRPCGGWTQAILNQGLWNTAILSISPSLEILSGRGCTTRYPGHSTETCAVTNAATGADRTPPHVQNQSEPRTKPLAIFHSAADSCVETPSVETLRLQTSDDSGRSALPVRLALSERSDGATLVESEFKYKSGNALLQSQLLTALDALGVVSSESPSDANAVARVQTSSETACDTTAGIHASRFRWDRIVLDLGCRREEEISVMEQAVTRLIPVTTTHPGSLESCGEIVAKYQRGGLANRVDLLFNQTSHADFAIEQTRLVQWCRACAGVVPRIVGTLPTDPRWEADLLSGVWSNGGNESAERVSDGTLPRVSRPPWHFLRRHRPTMATAIESVVPRLLVPPPESSDLEISEMNPLEIATDSSQKDEKKFAIPDVFRKVA